MQIIDIIQSYTKTISRCSQKIAYHIWNFVYLLLVGAGDVALEVFLEVPRERVPRDSISRSSISLPDISCTEINGRQLDNVYSLVNSLSDNISIIYICYLNKQSIELFNQS